MRRIKITRTNGTSSQAELPALEAETWIAQGIAQNWWGKPERWVTLEQEDVTGALETREVEIEPGVMVTEYKMPAQYTIQIEDMTAELAALKAKEDARFAKLQSMKPLAVKSLTALEMKQAIEFLITELFDERSSLGAELVKYAAQSKN